MNEKEMKETQVQRQMADLEKWTITLRDSVGQLADRLTPVLPKVPSVGENKLEEERSKLVPLAERLSGFSDRLAEASEIVNRLLNDIEL